MILPFIVTGITAGSIYGLAAVGLVLTYKTSGVFNFGHGAIAAGAAYVYYAVSIQHGAPTWLGLLVAVGGYGLLAGLLMELLSRRLVLAPTAYKIVATIGILLAVQASAALVFGPQSRPFPQFLPTRTFRFGGVNVGWDQLITALVALVATAALFVFFRTSRLGKAMRAVVDDADLLDMTGVDPVRVRRASWVIGSCFAALSGVLIAPLLQLDATVLTLLIVQAFGAAAIGAFSSLPVSYAGGLVVGLAAAVTSKLVVHTPELSALPQAVPFLTLFVVLLVLPRGRLQEMGRQVRLPAQLPSPLTAGRGLGLAAFGALLCALPFVTGSKLPAYSSALAYVVLFLSLALLVRTSGQVSLCQFGFAAVGASSLGHFQHHLPWLLALLAAGLVAVPVGALIALPAIRLSGLYLALATLGFGILLSSVVYTTGLMFGTGAGLDIARPDWLGLGTDKGYYYVLLAVVGASVALVTTIERARLGRLLRALADSPLALATHGTSVNVTRVIVFCVSAFLAAIAGGLLAGQIGVVNADSFAAFQSLTLVAVLVIAGRRPVSSAFVAAASLVVVPVYIDNADVASYLTLLFGVAAVAVGVAAGGATPGGTRGSTDPRSRWQRRLAAGGPARLLRPIAPV
ncbi:MAG: ABC transporter permease [Actinomycetota bacterium]|nr:ABC transporter permease [Actinomycetota bacterium]